MMKAVQKEREDKLRQVCKRYPNFHPEIVQKWTVQNKELDQVKKNGEALVQLSNQVFEVSKVDAITFEKPLPEKLTKELYIRLYQKIFATLRYDHYSNLESYREKEGLTSLKQIPEDKFQDMW